MRKIIDDFVNQSVNNSYKFTGYIRLQVDEKDISNLKTIPVYGDSIAVSIGPENKNIRLIFENPNIAIKFADKLNTLITAIQLEKDMSNVS